MEPHLDVSYRDLGTLICFALIAYIFYFLGNLNTSRIPILHLEPNDHQDQNLEAGAPSFGSNHRSERCKSVDTAHVCAQYMQGFKEGKRAFLQLGIHDFRRDMKQEINKLAQELQKKIDEVDRKEKIRQNWFLESRREMSSWREEQLNSKRRGGQAEDKSIVGWFRIGGRRSKGSVSEELETMTSLQNWPNDEVPVKSG